MKESVTHNPTHTSLIQSCTQTWLIMALAHNIIKERMPFGSSGLLTAQMAARIIILNIPFWICAVCGGFSQLRVEARKQTL